MNNLPSKIKNWYQIRPNDIRLAIQARGLNKTFNWSIPEDSILPFDRLELEIWIETGGVGMGNQEIMPQDIAVNVGYSANIMVDIIHSILDFHEEEGPRSRQEEILELIISSWTLSLNSNPRYLFIKDDLIDSIAEIICNHGVERNQILADKFIDKIIANEQIFTHGKLAIAAAMMQYIDDIRLQSMMMKHRSSKEIGRAEAKALHALSLAGRRAYTQGRIPPLEWPATKNWRYRYDK